MPAIRYDGNLETSAKNVPLGANAPVYTLPYAVATIYTDSTLTTLVPIFMDQALTLALPNPLTSDSQGRFGFWVNSGYYVYTITDTFGELVGTYSLSLLAGNNGAQGPPINFRGAYNPAIAYALGDAVYSGNSTYASLQNGNIGHDPLTNPSFWTLALSGPPSITIIHTFTASQGSPQTYSYNHSLNTSGPQITWACQDGFIPDCNPPVYTDSNNVTLTCRSNCTIAGTFTYVASGNNADLLGGLIAYYPMDESGANPVLVDHISANNIPTLGATGSSSGCTFSGSNSAGSISSTAGGVPYVPFNGGTPFTISAWLNLASIASASQFTFIGNNAPAETPGIEIYQVPGGQLTYLMEGTGGVPSDTTAVTTTSSSLLTVGTRSNVLVTYDGSGQGTGCKIYVNGVLAPSSIVFTAYSTSAAANQSTYIMASPTTAGGINNYTPGKMDHLRIYNRIINSDTIAAIVSGGI